MVNWKVYEILGMEKCQRFVRFDLNDHVNFREWSGNAICFDNAYPFNAWQIGDCLEIDLDATLCQSWAHEFSNTNMAKKVSSASLQRRVRELESRLSSSESNSSTQLVLRRNAETEKNDLQVAKRNLESTISDLKRDRDSWRSSSWSLQTERDGLKDQVREKNELIKSGEVVLRTTQNQLTTVQNQLTKKNTEYDDLSRRFNNLQIESNNKDNEIKTKEEKIVSLKAKLGEAEADILHRELVSKEKKLDELTRNLAINPPQRVKELREAYERLIKARENYNRDGVVAAQRDIDARKQEFLQTDISVDNLYKVYRNCEKVAEVRIKLEKIHEQRFEARQEVPTNN